MKCLIKNLIILFALIFLSLVFLGRTAYKSYSEAEKFSSQEEVEVNKDEDSKNFEILEVPNEKKRQMEESLGYEIADIKDIRLLDKDRYTKEKVNNNKEDYTIENISEVKGVLEFDGRDVYQSIFENKKEENDIIKIGERILKNDYMADFPIDAKLISNALGFDVKKVYILDLDLDLRAEGKSFTRINLYPEINHYDFEVHENGRKLSKGRAKEVLGAYLIVRKEKINES